MICGEGRKEEGRKEGKYIGGSSTVPNNDI
jgi:hypothetical protein